MLTTFDILDIVNLVPDIKATCLFDRKMKVSTIIVQFLLLSPLVSAVAITGVQMAQARGGAISEDGDCPSEPGKLKVKLRRETNETKNPHNPNCLYNILRYPMLVMKY